MNRRLPALLLVLLLGLPVFAAEDPSGEAESTMVATTKTETRDKKDESNILAFGEAF